ncbi:MAG: SCP2 sterol-binding domain-containing protein [Candidatus Helarchaeota archaeon]
MSDVTVKDIIQIKTLLFSNIYAFELIAQEDEMVQEEFGKLEAVIQWIIPNVVSGYLEIKDSKPKLFMNAEYENPTVTITFTDIQTAKDVLNGNADVTKLFLKGKVLVEGDLKKGMKIFTATELLEDYIAFFKNLK